MKLNVDNKELEIIVPISLEYDNPTIESIVANILEHKELYGFTTFLLSVPSAGWRSIGYPPPEYYVEKAKMFAEIKKQVAPHGITCGWWNTLTIKSGQSNEFVRMTKFDGSQTPFASCPLDANFQQRLAKDMAIFSQIAKPAFIFLQDDYSVHAASGKLGCFCKHHLQEFAKRTGKEYTREELVSIFQTNTPESIELHKQWRKLAKDSLVALSKRIREEVDKFSPEIPIGYMQTGAADTDGDCTEEVSLALAGENHTPCSRLYGTFYCGGETVRIPQTLHHVLYTKQHMGKNFKFLHESDAFPHTRYFTSGAQMHIIMSTAYSYGLDGSIFHTHQGLDNPKEEKVYVLMFNRERKRFNAVSRVARACNVKGVNIPYDPYYNSLIDSPRVPNCAYFLSRFGIPYTTNLSQIAFIDPLQAKTFDKDVIMQYLSKGLMLDGESAKILCERGFSEYLGVDVGNDIATVPFVYDLGAREVIRSKFIPDSMGKNMPIGHMYACGKNGKLLGLTVANKNCEIISDAYNFKNEHVCPAMTRFVNKLGGKIVVMGLTLAGNSSQALFNYRRKRLFEELIVWCDDSIAFVKDAPDVFCIMNQAISPEKSGFKGLLTITNLCDDGLDFISLHLPPEWRTGSEFYTLNIEGEWESANVTITKDGIKLNSSLNGKDIIYLLVA